MQIEAGDLNEIKMKNVFLQLPYQCCVTNTSPPYTNPNIRDSLKALCSLGGGVPMSTKVCFCQQHTSIVGQNLCVKLG